MKISNIRLGFATNSSSTHSIVKFKDLKDKPTHDSNEDMFGWNRFILVTNENIKSYLGQTLYQNLARLNIPNDIASTIAES